MTSVDIGYVAAVIVCSALILACVIAAIISNLIFWTGNSDGFAGVMAIVYPAVALLIAGLFVWGAWPPFNMDYHQYRQVAGTVSTVQSRFLGQDKSTSQIYAVQLAGSDQVYRCDDTRCSVLKPGDHLTLWCIREWQQASTPGYDCNFGDSGRES